MPKGPVLDRTTFYVRLRDGTYRHHDWNVINTSLGQMLEPRQIRLIEDGKVAQLDPYDTSFNSIQLLDANQAWALFGTDGDQLPRDYNTL